VGWALATTGDESAKKFVAAHTVGSRVAVAVDPRDASYSVLTTGIRFSHVFAAAICAAVFLAGLISALSNIGLPRPGE
jgi:hypothetical protein